jgi:FkbM family methyltransferase
MIKKWFLTFRWVVRHPLNRGAGWRALYQFGRAQVGARLVQSEVCVPFPNETRLLVPPQMKGSAHFIWPSLPSFEVMSFVAHFLRPGDLFVDIGANIGAFTILASGVAGARTVAFEPAPLASGCLHRNIRLNNLSDRVTPRDVALGSRAGKVQMTAGLGTENHIMGASNGVESVEVEMCTLDAELGDKDPTVIKMDVEGFESEVVAGGRKVLIKRSLLALIMEKTEQANRYGKNEIELHEWIRGQAFFPCSYDPEKRALQAVPPEKARGDIIYVRNLEAANERLRLGPPYRFAGKSI